MFDPAQYDVDVHGQSDDVVMEVADNVPRLREEPDVQSVEGGNTASSRTVFLGGPAPNPRVARHAVDGQVVVPKLRERSHACPRSFFSPDVGTARSVSGRKESLSVLPCVVDACYRRGVDEPVGWGA